MTHHEGQRLYLTYAERCADPHPVTGTQVFPVTVVRVDGDDFDVQPDYSADPTEAWTVLGVEVERRDVVVETEMAHAMNREPDPSTDNGYGPRAVND